LMLMQFMSKASLS
ncbi:pyridoxal-dependent decarboxylase, pyridoxal binding domain protein, partial [Vibrio parahaemolyticus V-223/04]